MRTVLFLSDPVKIEGEETPLTSMAARTLLALAVLPISKGGKVGDRVQHSELDLVFTVLGEPTASRNLAQRVRSIHQRYPDMFELGEGQSRATFKTDIEVVRNRTESDIASVLRRVRMYRCHLGSTRQLVGYVNSDSRAIKENESLQRYLAEDLATLAKALTSVDGSQNLIDDVVSAAKAGSVLPPGTLNECEKILRSTRIAGTRDLPDWLGTALKLEHNSPRHAFEVLSNWKHIRESDKQLHFATLARFAAQIGEKVTYEDMCRKLSSSNLPRDVDLWVIIARAHYALAEQDLDSAKSLAFAARSLPGADANIYARLEVLYLVATIILRQDDEESPAWAVGIAAAKEGMRLAYGHDLTWQLARFQVRFATLHYKLEPKKYYRFHLLALETCRSISATELETRIFQNLAHYANEVEKCKKRWLENTIRALECANAMRDHQGLFMTLGNAAIALYDHGKFLDAVFVGKEALKHAVASKLPLTYCKAIEQFALPLVALERYEEGARYLLAAAAEHARGSSSMHKDYVKALEWCEENLSEVRIGELRSEVNRGHLGDSVQRYLNDAESLCKELNCPIEDRFLF